MCPILYAQRCANHNYSIKIGYSLHVQGLKSRVHRGLAGWSIVSPGSDSISHREGGCWGWSSGSMGPSVLHPLAFRMHLWSWCCCLLGQEVEQLQLHVFHSRKMEESGAVFASGEQRFPSQPWLTPISTPQARTVLGYFSKGHHPFCPMMYSCPEEPLLSSVLLNHVCVPRGAHTSIIVTLWRGLIPSRTCLPHHTLGEIMSPLALECSRAILRFPLFLSEYDGNGTNLGVNLANITQ